MTKYVTVVHDGNSDTCPNCGDKNYQQNKVGGAPDCSDCFIFVCTLCAVFDDGDYTCKNCIERQRLEKK